jgi:hypothetical protein
MNPRAEAVARLGALYDARVLEPSPPAIEEPPWFAEDPVGRGEPAGELPRVSPVAGGDLRWQDLIEEDPELAPWCSERWLGAYRRLGAAPQGLPVTRRGLHRLAELVISPARRQANGKIGLRFTRGGFGTPFFGADVQLRVLADRLIVQSGGSERAAPITTLAEMARHVGGELLAEMPVVDGPIEVDVESSAFLGEWFGFAASVLEELRAACAEELRPSRVQLWPEHFDMAIEIGEEQRGARAAYGASPGDELHPEPYLYVVPWGEVPDGELWQVSAFPGAQLPYQALASAGDQRALALRFFGVRLDALRRRGSPAGS